MNQKNINSFDISNLNFMKRRCLYRKDTDKKTNMKITDLRALASLKKIIKKDGPNNEIININNENDENNDLKKSETKNNKNDKKADSNKQIILFSLKSNFKKDRRNILQRKIGAKTDIINEFYVLNSLLKNPHKRNIEDINRIAFFISGCSLINGFLDINQKNPKDIEKLIYEISYKIKYKFIPENSIIFRIGDEPDYFYVIIQGKVDILKPKKYIIKINGFEYFKILMNYYIKEEYYILNEIIKLNNHIFEIDQVDLYQIKFFFLDLELNDYFKSPGLIKGEEIIIIIKNCFCEKEIINKINMDKNLIINGCDPNNWLKIKKLKENIYKYIPKYFSSKIKSYIKLYDKKNENDMVILKYSHIVELKDKDFFGDIAFDINRVRNATVLALEDTHLCYLEKEHYDLYLRPEKKDERLSSINFLYDNFFFKNINKTVFESIFFNNFIYEENPKNTILFNQYAPSDYLYFVKHGEIELTNKSSIIKINFLTKYISQLNLENNRIEYIKKIRNFNPRNLEPGFKNDIYFLKNDFISQKKYFLFNIFNKDIIGLESIIFDIPYLYEAKVISKSAFLYKIEENTLFQLIKHNEYLLGNMTNEGKAKMKILLERFISNNSMQIKIVDNNFSKKLLYNKDNENNYSQNNKNQKDINPYNNQKNVKFLSNKCSSEGKIISKTNLMLNNFNIKKSKSFKNLIIFSDNNKKEKRYSNIKQLNTNNILLIDKSNNREENQKINNFFFTQPIFSNKNLAKLEKRKDDKETINKNGKKEFEQLLPSIDLFEKDNSNDFRNTINYKNNFNISKNKNIPYLLKTFVNFDKIKKLKLNLKKSYSSYKYNDKKAKIVNIIKKSFSYTNKKVIKPK